MKKYAKVIKVGNRLAIVLPEEVEKDLGITLNSPISILTSLNKIILQVEISKVEMEVLKRLLSLKFNERTEEKVNENFTAAQKKIIKDLLKRKVITLYKGKYEKPVYNIPDKIYNILVKFGMVSKKSKIEKEEGIKEKGEKREEIEKEKEKKEKEKKEEKEKREESVEDKFKRLTKAGYLVIEDEEEAKEISKILKEKIKKKIISASEFKGIRGFDKKYYIVRKKLIENYYEKIINLLKEKERSAEEIRKLLKVDADLVSSLLAILNEDGEIIEKKKGIFALP
ncbi:MAG: hypothetical protein QXS37_02575 [Candidatus Aenigmatarchaeota archaeon]